jgi:hypothetical protein
MVFEATEFRKLKKPPRIYFWDRKRRHRKNVNVDGKFYNNYRAK